MRTEDKGKHGAAAAFGGFEQAWQIQTVSGYENNRIYRRHVPVICRSHVRLSMAIGFSVLINSLKL
jgi:hypothetical protein